MAEDDDLKLKIAMLSGRINLKEQEIPGVATQRPNLDHVRPGHPYASSSRGQRGRPPYRGGYRGGRHARGAAPAHKNRSLVLKSTTNPGTPPEGTDPALAGLESVPLTVVPPAATTNWVAKNDRHRQLINSSVYEREVQGRARDMEESRKLKAQQRDEKEKLKLSRHLQRVSSSMRYNNQSARPTAHELVLDGIRFRVINGGSKLLKIAGETQVTPRTVKVGGVPFIRSKNGNLYRSGLVKAKRGGVTIKKINEPCQKFTTSGACIKGPRCAYNHDPNKVAICKQFLQTGACPANDSCDLSHDPTPERVPACVHFLRGKCSNETCRYAHVRVRPGAPVCRPFATLGYCEKGINCTERHVHECPDYANTGSCNKRKCRLPHVDRAGQIRKKAAAGLEGAKNGTDEEESDLSSAEDSQDDANSEDIDSEGLEDDGQDVAMQQDYIHF